MGGAAGAFVVGVCRGVVADVVVVAVEVVLEGVDGTREEGRGGEAGTGGAGEFGLRDEGEAFGGCEEKSEAFERRAEGGGDLLEGVARGLEELDQAGVGVGGEERGWE